MIDTSFGTKSVVIAIAVVMLSVSAASAQNEFPARAVWDAPTGTIAAVEYIVQLSTNNGPWVEVGRTAETELPLTLNYFDSYQMRVAGIDASGGQGPFSSPSVAYTGSEDNSIPGPPGQPTWH